MAFFHTRLFTKKWLIACLCLLCTSCFDIKEEVSINKDGSGHFRLLLDFSAHQEMLTQLVEEASLQGQTVFGEGKQPFNEMIQVWIDAAEELNQINGIKNATAITNTDEFIYGWQFDFEDIEALNLVLAIRDGGEFNTSYLPAYAFDKNMLTKHSVFSFHKLFYQLSENSADKLPEALKKQKKAIFAGVRYYCSISVEGKVKKCSNKAYSISSDKKTASLVSSLEDVQLGQAYIGSQIKFK